MIGFLRGSILTKSAQVALVDVGGVGYTVEISTSTSCQMAVEGDTVELFIHTHVREDSIRLFGFLTRFDQSLFEQLLSVSSIGPKMALALMGPLSGDELADTILHGDVKTLTSIPGVGLKTAERIVLELKTKLQKLYVASHRPAAGRREGAQASETSDRFKQTQILDDARSALENLGYKDKQINDALADFERRAKDGEQLAIEPILKDALRRLAGRVLSQS